MKPRPNQNIPVTHFWFATHQLETTLNSFLSHIAKVPTIISANRTNFLSVASKPFQPLHRGLSAARGNTRLMQSIQYLVRACLTSVSTQHRPEEA